MISCKNCSTEFEGKFCSNCGEKAKAARISFPQILNDIRSYIIHFDQGFMLSN